ncbi:oligosaccharide flippase family protein [Faecalimonas umbilicata]|uniref:oligosaccharide flippase family protein n=1 Tax=Faecalimonas umbilicata TaxID=1912855 RepID=UPI0039958083
MNQKHSIKLNFIMNFLLTASSFIFPLITFPYVSRILLPVGTGKVSFATSVISYFTMFAMLGIPTYGIRACAKVRENKEELSRTVHEIMFINFIMTILTYIVFFISIMKVERFQQDRNLLLVSSIAIVLQSLGVNWLYQGLEEYVYITVRSLIFKILGLGLLFIFVKQKEDYIIYGAITVFTGYGSYILNMIRLKKFINCRPVGHYNLKRHMKPILVFFAMSVATSIYTNLDTVMLGFMNTDTEVGYYHAAVKMKSLLVSLITSMGAVLLPRLSYYYENGKNEEFNKMIAKVLNFVLIMGIPLSVYFIMFSKESILLLSGSQFIMASVSMKLITPTVLFIGITNVLGIQIMVPRGEEKNVLISVIVGAAVDFFLNLVMIPRHGAAGAAMATTVAEFSVLVVQICILRKLLNNIKKEVHWIKICIPVVIATICSFIFKSVVQVKSNFILLVCSATIYFGIYGILLWGVKEPEVREIGTPYINKIKSKLKKMRKR